MQIRGQKTHQQILEAALGRFAQAGYEATSVAEICAAAGVSKGAFYHHFPSKQAVFLALLDDWLAQIDSVLHTISLEQTTTAEVFFQMTSIMESIYDQARGKLPMFLEFWTQASHDPVIWSVLIEPYHHYQDYFRELFQKGIQDGSIKGSDPDIGARAVVSLALGLLLQGLLDPEGANWNLVTKQTFSLLMKGIST